MAINGVFFFSDLENQILKEQKSVMVRNAFLGNFKRDDFKQMDAAIQRAKNGLDETTSALKQRQSEIRSKERESLQAKMKIQLNAKRNQRAKKPSEKGGKKKNKTQSTSDQPQPTSSS